MRSLLWILFCLSLCALAFSKEVDNKATKPDGEQSTTPKSDGGEEEELMIQINFECIDKGDGYYVDSSLDCQFFHACLSNGTHVTRETFMCPQGSRFNQQRMVCDYEMPGGQPCQESVKFYYLNESLFQDSDDDSTTTGSPTSDSTPATSTTSA